MNKLGKRLILEIAAVATILLMAGTLRFCYIRTRPGFEWDEPLYEKIAQNTLEYGYPTLEVEGGHPMPNLYHPPFDHYLKAFWFEVTGASGIGQARILSAAESIFMLLLSYLLVRYVAGREAAVVALILTSTCGWIVYTNRLDLLENGMMPIGVIGLLLYAVAFKKDRCVYYILSGVVLTMAAMWKHTGLVFLMVPFFTWLLTRKAGEHHLVLLLVAGIVILFYVAAMSYVFGEAYWIQSEVQVRRALGIGMVEYRGLAYGWREVAQALTKTYWIFFITIACLIVGPVMVIVRLIQCVFHRRQPHHPILLSWAVAGILLLAVVALKSPQYWVIMLVPLYAFLASELRAVLKRADALTVSAVLVVVMGLNLQTWYMLIVQHPENALLETYDFAASFIPADAKVLTEECIGVQLGQEYFNVQIHRAEEDLERIDPTWVILYYSATAKPPASPGLDALLQRSTFVTSFSGFKEEIKIFRVESRKSITVTPLTVPESNDVPQEAEPPTPTLTLTLTATATPRPTSTPTALPTEMATEMPTATPTPTSEVTYVVARGDSLYRIAQRYYGDWIRWRVIYEANQGIIKNPSLVYPGQVLVIPRIPLEPKTEY